MQFRQPFVWFPTVTVSVDSVRAAIRFNSENCYKYLAHEIAQCHWQGIRLRMSQADGRTTLGITISNEHLLSFTGKVNAEIHAGCGFSRASLLVD